MECHGPKLDMVHFFAHGFIIVTCRILAKLHAIKALERAPVPVSLLTLALTMFTSHEPHLISAAEVGNI